MNKLRQILLFLVLWYPVYEVIGQASDGSGDRNVFSNVKNDSSWHRFVSRVNEMEVNHKGVINIVHLGDSHIQGGYFPNRFRELLDNSYGIAGRGWIFPYSLSGVNGPEDVIFDSNNRWVSEKGNHLLFAQEPTISGYHLHASDSIIQVSFSLKLLSETRYPFSEIDIYHTPVELLPGDGFSAIKIKKIPFEHAGITRIIFSMPKDSICIRFKNSDFRKTDLSLFGMILKSSKPGFLYHAIGINGASFDTYTRVINYRSILKQLAPDLVIISLGTNDAMTHRIDKELFQHKIKKLIDSIRVLVPNVCILFTTPGDHLLNNKYSNPNLLIVRESIINVSLRESCLYWDFFAVMGGLGSAKFWKSRGFMFKDMKHLSQKGYAHQGTLFFDAFDKAIKKTNGE